MGNSSCFIKSRQYPLKEAEAKLACHCGMSSEWEAEALISSFIYINAMVRMILGKVIHSLASKYPKVRVGQNDLKFTFTPNHLSQSNYLNLSQSGQLFRLHTHTRSGTDILMNRMMVGLSLTIISLYFINI